MMKQTIRAARGRSNTPKSMLIEQVNRLGRKRKKRRGNVAGSRTNPVAEQSSLQNKERIYDSRTGSKKPIPLVTAKALPAVNEKQKRHIASNVLKNSDAQQELALLENDHRLELLLDRVDIGETLSSVEQTWLDQTLDRIDTLMEQLGIEPDDSLHHNEMEEDVYLLLKEGN